VQLTIFDALAALPPSEDVTPAIQYQRVRIKVYQGFIDHLLTLSQQRWEAAQGDEVALARWKAWAQSVNRDSVQRLLRLQAEAKQEIERLERG
jgi:hypothetical protein